MTGYVFGAKAGMQRSGTSTVSIIIPAGTVVGNLVLAKTSNGAGTPGQTCTPPDASWIQLSPLATTDSILYGHFAVSGDAGTSKSFVWSGGVAAGDIAYWSGDVYPDLTTIVGDSNSRQAVSQNLVSFSNVNTNPPTDHCLIVCGGRKLRTNSTSGSFGGVNAGSLGGNFTQISSAPPGAISFAQACVWDYWIQGTATAIPSAAQTWSVNDATSQNEQGWIVALKSQVAPPPSGALSVTGATPSVVGATNTILNPLTARVMEKARRIFLPSRKIWTPAYV